MKNYSIKKVETKNEMKEFLKLFDYWHKKGLVGFVPIFILYRHKDKGELYLLKDTNKNKTIGIAWIIERKRPYNFYQVKTLALSPDYHAKGLGEYFLRGLVDPLHKQGFDLITSVVSGNEPAMNLYRKVGFKTYDTKTSKKGVITDEMVFPAGKGRVI